MKIVDDKLVRSARDHIEHKDTPNISAGKVIKPRFVVIHYTAGSSFEGAVSWLTNPSARASAHIVIGRDGRIAQLAPFTARTWHAGRSAWRGLPDLNSHSIGIELDNAGVMEETADGWVSSTGRHYPDGDVMEAVHQHDTAERGWHRYSEPQLSRLADLLTALRDTYEIEDILGHDDIAPGRKIDPGPAFPMARMRDRTLGREDGGPEIVRTRTALNIRSGPSTEFGKLEGSPLPKGETLHVIARHGVWLAVEHIVDGEPDKTGWVHGGYVV